MKKRKTKRTKRTRKVNLSRSIYEIAPKPTPFLRELQYQTAVAGKKLRRDIENLMLAPAVTSVTTIEGDPEVLSLAEKQTMPTDSAARKNTPLCTGVLDYFPAALAAVARLSKFGNDKHNPGEPLHWARGKSSDHADCILRHLADRGKTDGETGMSHTVEVAWRALALLQEEEERLRGAPQPRGAY